MLVGSLVVIDHVQCHHLSFQFGVAHHNGQLQQLRCDVGIFYAEQYLLIVSILFVVLPLRLLTQDNLFRRMFRHHGADDAGDEDHDDDTVQHLVGDQKDARTDFQSHTHHHHRDSTGSMGAGQSEHHVSRRFRQSEQQAGQIGRYRLAERTEEVYQGHNPQHVRPLKQRFHVDEHTHTYQEVGNEDGITRELDAVHQGRHVRDIPI